MKKLIIYLFALVLVLTFILSSFNLSEVSNVDSEQYAGVPPVKIPVIPPPDRQ